MDLEAKKAVIRRVRDNLKVTEIFCTRILKGHNGSVLVGLTATLDGDTSIEDGEVAALILGSRVDQLAYERALAGSVLSEKFVAVASRRTKHNYSELLKQHFKKREAEPAPVKKVRSIA